MKKRRSILAVAVLMLAVLLTSCGSAALAPNSGSYDTEGYYDNKVMLESVAETTASSSFSFDSSYGAGVPESDDSSYERKIISTCTINAETKEFDAVILKIEESIKAQNGYIESSYITGVSENRDGYRASRRATYTIRIPSIAMEAYIASVEPLFNITSKSENARDISATYYDTQARLDSLKIQEERLLEMLSQSNDLKYLLELEDKLSEVRYNIESLTSTIKRYDNSVDYATVNLNLSEVVEYTEPVEEPITFGQRISDAFSQSWSNFADGIKDFCVEFMYALPALAVLAVFVIIIVIIVRSCIKKYKKNKSQNNGENKQ